MKGYIPNFFTSMNLVLGCLATIEIFEGKLENVIYYTLLAGVMDFLDGFSARMLKADSAIGKDLDSLADLVSFGVVPALLMVQMLKQSTDNSWLPYLPLLMAALSAIRLAKFNHDERQTSAFYGLPTPANALFINTLPILASTVFFAPYLSDPVVLASIGLVASFLLVSEIKLIALKFTNYGWKDNALKYLLVLISIGALATFGLVAVPFLIMLYLIGSIFANLLNAKNEASS